MIEYLTNLLYLVHLKLSGKKIQGSKCVERLAELRCVSIELKNKQDINVSSS